MHKKTIILGMPKSFHIYKSFIKNLEFHGFIVHDICIPDEKLKYENFFQKLHNFVRKTFLNDREFKNKLKLLYHEKEILEKLTVVENADYALIIRPDLYSFKIIDTLKAKAKKTIAYQWDGLHRYPTIYNYLDIFDSFFIFDEQDINVKQHLRPITNFYFDFNLNINTTSYENDVYFLGYYIPNRMPEIIDFLGSTASLNLKYDINILGAIKNGEPQVKHENIKILEHSVTYQENIEKVKNSNILLEFLDTVHNGLSLRAFEALAYNKKLITSNQSIKSYDFYHPDNIFIWGEDAIGKLSEFIRKPYQPIDENTKLKYSFKNWINYVTGEANCIPIKLPKNRST